ncbi:hypothetical protein WICMUC_004961 [Wickerhamomyces mucosus]|uniref:Exocyst complex component Sec3 PIP2-binding N-terminal domain-containing protein n=1 Tax=Wickerhamomyces mucosus TaxID=1378264 RepID=A0A9P8PE03_9ASCO|nr:hypothetical protein WICMUC_004961 [Wickerhamomyces mucosus]
MAITSPFKKTFHSRESSREEKALSPKRKSGNTLNTPIRTNTSSSQQQRLREAGSRSQSGVQKSNTITSNVSSSSVSSSTLAKQYEIDRQKLVKYCFSQYDSDGVLLDSYITHVRIIEDSAFPSSRPSANSNSSSKKQRILALAVKKDGSVNLHKGRENANGSFQIGRTWSLNELQSITKDSELETGFTCNLGKDYYWETNSSKERQVFISSLVRTYRKFKNGLVPILNNWDLSIFQLDAESYKIFLNKELISTKKSVSSVESKSSESPRKFESSKKDQVQFQSIIQAQVQRPRINESEETLVSVTPSYNSLNSSIDKSQIPSVTPFPKETSKATSSFRSMVSDENLAPNSEVSLEIKSSSGTSKQSLPRDVSQIKPNSAASNVQKESFDDPFSPKDKMRSKSVAESEGKEINRKSLDPAVNAQHILNPTSFPSKDEKDGALLEQNVEERKNSLTELNNLKEEPTTVTKIASSVRDVEIFTHKPSLGDNHLEGSEIIEKDYDGNLEDVNEGYDDYDDDFTELYNNDDDDDDDDGDNNHNPNIGELIEETQAEVRSKDLKEKLADRTQESTDFSFNDSRINEAETQPTTSDQANGEYEDVDETLSEISEPYSPHHRFRGNTIDSAIDDNINTENNDSVFEDIFDEINWEATDDTETLTAKLLQELANTEYEATKNLISVQEKSNDIRHYQANILQECNKLNPLFDFFAVELSGFASDIKHVEYQGQGLQVETSNKKNLWNDLQNLLNTVSVDESSLSILLKSDINSDLANIEIILAELEKAILAIRGNDKSDESLSEMRALKERRKTYEDVALKFLSDVKANISSRFQTMVQEAVKENLNQSELKGHLSKLMPSSSLTLFFKNVSEKEFNDLVSVWQAAINLFYQDYLGQISRSIVKVTENSSKYSLINPVIEPFKSKSSRTEIVEKLKQDRLREQFGIHDESKVNSNTENDAKDEASLYDYILQFFKEIKGHIILQQDFLLKFFHLVNEKIELSQYIDVSAIGVRSDLLKFSKVEDVEINRSNARDILYSINSIFQPHLDNFFRLIVRALRNNENFTPLILTYIQVWQKRFISSNQEFLLSIFKKLGDRLTTDWNKFVDNESKIIERNPLGGKTVKEISNIVKNFIYLIDEIESKFEVISNNHAEIEVSKLEARSVINLSYYNLSNALINNLERELSSLSSIETANNRYKIDQVDETTEKRIQMVNLVQNSNWLLESISSSGHIQFNEHITTLRPVFNKSKDLYVNDLLKTTLRINKVVEFVKDVQEFLKENTGQKNMDPSKRNAYSKVNFAKILQPVDIKLLDRVVGEWRTQVTRDFSSESDEIQKQLIEKIWSALQAQMVSISMSLDGIIGRYYNDIEPRFNKKDIISIFNSARLI